MSTTSYSPPPNDHLIPFTSIALNSHLRQALQDIAYPIPPHAFCSWHSLRHGRAVDLSAQGLTAPALCTQGRWHSTAAANLYLYFLSPKYWPTNLPLHPHPPPIWR